MKELYSPAEAGGMERKKRIGIALVCAVLALSLTACIVLCVFTTTGNAARMEGTAIVTATLGAWAALWLWAFVVRPAKAEADHIRSVLAGEGERVTGRVRVTRERVWIRGNITLRTVYVSTREGLRRCSVNSRKAKELAGAGEYLTLSLVGGYAAAYAPADPVPGRGEFPPESKGLRWRTSALGKLLSQVPLYLICLILCTFFWSWVFTRVNDAPVEEKVTVFVDACGLRDVDLAVELETGLPGGIRKIKVHPVSYVMMDGKDLQTADIFLLRASSLETYRDYLAPGEGILAYDAAAGTGAATEYIQYAPEGLAGEDCYLYYGSGSVHTGSLDNAALEVAEHLMRLK